MRASRKKNFGLASGGDYIPLPPTLNGSVAVMREFISHRPDTPERLNDLPCVHTFMYVECVQDVNVENVHRCEQCADMKNSTIGSRLVAIKSRAGRTLDEIAKDAGYKGRSGVQKYFSEDYDPPALDAVVAGKLCKALVGFGSPAITQDEIFGMVGSYELMAKGGELPVVGYVGAGGEILFEDAYVQGDGMYHIEVLPGLDPLGLIGLEVKGDSMYPTFREGYVVFINRDGWNHVESDALNDWAVCRVSDGRTLLKEIRPSRQEGCYDLISQNAPPIEGVKLEWATPVVGYRKRR